MEEIYAQKAERLVKEYLESDMARPFLAESIRKFYKNMKEDNNKAIEILSKIFKQDVDENIKELLFLKDLISDGAIFDEETKQKIMERIKCLKNL